MMHDAGTNDLKNRGIPVDWVAPVEGTPILDQVVQVTKGSKNKELAWKFIDAYLSPEVQPPSRPSSSGARPTRR